MNSARSSSAEKEANKPYKQTQFKNKNKCAQNNIFNIKKHPIIHDSNSDYMKINSSLDNFLSKNHLQEPLSRNLVMDSHPYKNQDLSLSQVTHLEHNHSEVSQDLTLDPWILHSCHQSRLWLHSAKEQKAEQQKGESDSSSEESGRYQRPWHCQR